MDKWSTEFPTEPGWYWFYGYRYGGIFKIVCGDVEEPELCQVKVLSVAENKIILIADMYESEVECPHFMRMDIPDLPEIEENAE